MFALVHDLFLKTVCKTSKYRRCQPELVSMAWCRLSFRGCFFRGWGVVCVESHTGLEQTTLLELTRR